LAPHSDHEKGPVVPSILSESEKNRLVNKFKPIAYLDTGEKFLPSTFEYICENSTLNAGDKILVPEGKLSAENLIEESKKFPETTHISIPEKIWGGANRFNLFKVPFYYTTYEKDNYLIIQYCFLYPYNGPFMVCGKPYGAHTGDLEHVDIYVNKITKKIVKMYYGAHRSYDGMHVDSDDIIFVGSRPVVFMAKHSHACYWYQGTTYRVFCCANDHTDNDIRWDPDHLVCLDDKSWNQFPGMIGQEPVFGKHDWYHNETEKNTNCCIQIFCPWY